MPTCPIGSDDVHDGMEQEYIDAPYYYSGSGQFYSPRLVRSLSEVGQTSSQSAGGPAGSAFAALSGASNSGLFSPNNYATNAENIGGGVAAGALAGFLLGGEVGGTGGGPAGYVVGALIGGAIGAIASLVEDLLGGGSPPLLRQLLHARHPLYRDIIRVSAGEIPDEKSAAPTNCSADPYATVDGAVRAVAPLANAMSARTGNECGGAIIATPGGYAYTGPVEPAGASPCGGFQSLPPGYVASYHTHPATCSGGVPSEPSQDDLDFAARSKAPVYFITPGGEISVIKPGGGPVVPLQKCGSPEMNHVSITSATEGTTTWCHQFSRRTARLLISIVFLALLSCLTAKTVAFAQPLPLTSLISLISRPEKYDGKNVVVIGFGTFGFENSYLYLSPYDAQHLVKQNAIWLSVKGYQFTRFRSLDHQTIAVEGTFHLPENPKNGAYWTNYPNGFIEVTKLRPSEPQNPLGGL